MASEIISDKEYFDILESIKAKIVEASRNAIFSVNREMIFLYWEIGKDINNRSVWGNKFVQNLEKDLRLNFPNKKGLSARNLRYMAKFAQIYPDDQILHQLGAKLPWRHHTELMDKVKDEKARIWYMQQIIENGWSRSLLLHQIDLDVYKRQVLAPKVSNFKTQLPSPQSELVEQAMKDPYIFEVLTHTPLKRERNVEEALVQNMKSLLLEFGTGFAFWGNQYRLEVENVDYHIDMLFYNLKLKRYVVVELKKAEFQPEFAGKLNFYISAVDTLLKSETDNPTIGMLLCKDKKSLTAEFALRNINTPIGVAEYKLVSKLPKEFENVLPSAEDIRTRIKL